MLTEKELEALLPCRGLGEPLLFFDRLPSTNDEAARQALAGIGHGAVVVADEQTQGRGRLDRQWLTAPGGGLAMSLVLRPESGTAGTSLQYAGLGALAVARALEKQGLSPAIKWPNDVLLGGRKTAGILAEASWQDDILDYLILGIGVNVHPAAVPPPEELRYPATCVDWEAGRTVERAALLREVLCEAGALLQKPVRSWVSAWEKRLAFRGERVKVTVAERRLEGVLEGLDPSGRARLRMVEETKTLATGEIRPCSVDSEEE